MRQQFLDPISTVSAEAVVRRLGAIQASAAELSIRLRQSRSPADEIDRAIADGRLIKTFAFRGATHLMTPEDAGVYLALRASSRMWELPSWQSFYKLKPSHWSALRKAVREALADGPVTRDELKAAVTAHRQFKHLEQTFSKTLLKPLTWLGEMSFGQPRDGLTTFQRLDGNARWAGIPELDFAGPKAIEDYLHVYGPATEKNLHYWLAGLGAAKFIRPWLKSLKDRLATVKIEGGEAYVLRNDLETLQSALETNVIRLLPAYDQWVMGPGTFDTNIIPKEIRAPVSRGANIVIFGGRLAGSWTVANDTVTIIWSDKRKAPKEEIANEVKRFAPILERSLDWTIGRQ
jgi:hypothetical protein